jgi:chemotaxis protein histidine kinase CheA
MKTVALLFAVAALCSALPSDDEAHAAAKETIDMLLQEGKDDSACRDLAKTTIKEIKDSIDAGQKAYDAVDKGFDCHKEGQAAVTNAKTEKTKADKKYEDAKKATTAACSVSVTFSPKPYNSLKENECSQFFADPAYTAAKKKCNDAKAEEAKYSGEAQVAAKAVTAAETAAAKAKAECECKTHKANTAAWEAASKSHDANAKAWTKAHHMLCVLDGKSYVSAGSCSVPPVPKVTKKSVCSLCNGSTCKSEIASVVPVID